MSTTARKARKRAGVKFSKPAKVGTPLVERAWFNATLPGAPGTRHAHEFVARSVKRRIRALDDRGLIPSTGEPRRRVRALKKLGLGA